MGGSCMNPQEASKITASGGDHVTHISTPCNAVLMGQSSFWPNFPSRRPLPLLFCSLEIPLPVSSVRLASAWPSELCLNGSPTTRSASRGTV